MGSFVPFLLFLWFHGLITSFFEASLARLLYYFIILWAYGLSFCHSSLMVFILLLFFFSTFFILLGFFCHWAFLSKIGINIGLASFSGLAPWGWCPRTPIVFFFSFIEKHNQYFLYFLSPLHTLNHYWWNIWTPFITRELWSKVVWLVRTWEIF